MSIEIGDIKWHHEEGRIFEVEILDVISDIHGETDGTTFKLRATGNTKSEIGDEPKKDAVLSVWRINDKKYSAYVGWHLLDY